MPTPSTTLGYPPLPLKLVDNGDGTFSPSFATGGVFTDRSGTITAGGTAQQIVGANTARRYLLIQNKSTNTVSLWVDFAGVTAVQDSPSLEIPPGVTYIWDGTAIPTGGISVVSSLTGLKYTAKEM